LNMFSVRLKAMRKERKETQEDIARLLKVQRTTVGEYERGNIRPPMDKMKVLADHFEVSVDYLMGNTNFQTAEERNEESPNDVSKAMKKILEDLQKNQRAMMFDGEVLDDESRELLISSLEQSLRMGKIMQKRNDAK
jgi:transcriptional regulator with XRE-family HTH domain